MQQDRIEGNISHDSDGLYNMYLGTKAENLVPDLPKSSHIKIIDGPSKGAIHVWTPYFARFPRMCVNCDAHGNTDPAAWQQAPEIPIPSTKPEATNIKYSGEAPGDVPQVQSASTVLGTDDNFTQDYTNPSVIKAALPLPKESSNEVVSEVIKVSFDNLKQW